jgi:2,3-bisphosphoglycerate-dependent phosphoglycerate mutase
VSDDDATQQPRSLSGVPGALEVGFLLDGTEHCELVLVRHGQQQHPDLKVSGVADMIDPPLSAVGERQALALGERFAHQRVDAVYTSNLKRAHRTGEAVAERHGLEVHVRPDLREIEVYRDLPQDRPLLEVLGREQLLGFREQMLRHMRWDVYPGSEGSHEFRRRVCTAIDGIVASHPGERVVVACHGGVINAYVADILGTTADMFFRPAHTAVNVVRAAVGGRRAIETVGDSSHLNHAEGLLTY